MKRRLGFVSNSSSSSFMILGRKISQADIQSIGYELAHEGNLYATDWGDWNDGADFFSVTPKMLANHIKYHIINGESGCNYLDFYTIDKELSDENDEGTPINREDIHPDGSMLFNFEVTYHATQDFDMFAERHLRDVHKFVKAPLYKPKKKKVVESEKEVPREELIDLD